MTLLHERERINQLIVNRRGTLKSKYGLTPEDYMDRWDLQKGRCAVCKTKNAWYGDPRKQVFDVDHNHETGKVRGLLCNPCNTMLGNAQENPGRLRSGAEYLEKWEGR
jgi:hypothetical protein